MEARIGGDEWLRMHRLTKLVQVMAVWAVNEILR